MTYLYLDTLTAEEGRHSIILRQRTYLGHPYWRSMPAAWRLLGDYPASPIGSIAWKLHDGIARLFVFHPLGAKIPPEMRQEFRRGLGTWSLRAAVAQVERAHPGSLFVFESRYLSERLRAMLARRGVEMDRALKTEEIL